MPAKATQVKSFVSTITPLDARGYLKTSKKNRHLSPRKITQFADDLKEGRWDVNGEAIIFNDKGKLINGHHRMHAIVEADTAMRTLVVTGVSEAAVDTIDTGRSRRAWDLLEVKGVAEGMASKVAASAARWCLMFHSHRMDKANKGQIIELQRSFTNRDIVKYVKQNPKLMDSVALVMETGTRKLIPPGIMAALHYEFSAINKAQAAEFTEQLLTGVALGKNSPVRWLRNRLEESAVYKHRRLNPEHKAAITIRAWNMWRDKEPFKTNIQYKAGRRKGGKMYFPQPK
jgi:hypothetical protein